MGQLKNIRLPLCLAAALAVGASPAPRPSSIISRKE